MVRCVIGSGFVSRPEQRKKFLGPHIYHLGANRGVGGLPWWGPWWSFYASLAANSLPKIDAFWCFLPPLRAAPCHQQKAREASI